MPSLWTLFGSRRAPTTYARLDGNGRCLAFKTCRQAPAGPQWVAIHEANLAWLGQLLPATARRTRRLPHSWYANGIAA